MAVYDLPPYVAPPSYLTGQKIPRNPALPQTPLGVYTDSQFEAADAAARAAYLRKYNDLQQQIGYMDANGNIIKGDIESTADAQRADAQRSMFLAGVDTINQAQNEGNYFSGYQVQRKANAEYPFAAQIAGLDVSVPKALAQAEEGQGQALEDYIIQRNQLLADAAARAAQDARDHPPGAPTPDPNATPPPNGQGPLDNTGPGDRRRLPIDPAGGDTTPNFGRTMFPGDVTGAASGVYPGLPPLPVPPNYFKPLKGF